MSSRWENLNCLVDSWAAVGSVSCRGLCDTPLINFPLTTPHFPLAAGVCSAEGTAIACRSSIEAIVFNVIWKLPCVEYWRLEDPPACVLLLRGLLVVELEGEGVSMPVPSTIRRSLLPWPTISVRSSVGDRLRGVIRRELTRLFPLLCRRGEGLSLLSLPLAPTPPRKLPPEDGGTAAKTTSEALRKLVDLVEGVLSNSLFGTKGDLVLVVLLIAPYSESVLDDAIESMLDDALEGMLEDG